MTWHLPGGEFRVAGWAASETSFIPHPPPLPHPRQFPPLLVGNKCWSNQQCPMKEQTQKDSFLKNDTYRKHIMQYYEEITGKD